VTINPKAVPAGTELSFGNFERTNSGLTAIGLIDPASYTCSSKAPADMRGFAAAGFTRGSAH